MNFRSFSLNNCETKISFDFLFLLINRLEKNFIFHNQWIKDSFENSKNAGIKSMFIEHSSVRNHPARKSSVNPSKFSMNSTSEIDGVINDSVPQIPVNLDHPKNLDHHNYIAK